MILTLCQQIFEVTQQFEQVLKYVNEIVVPMFGTMDVQFVNWRKSKRVKTTDDTLEPEFKILYRVLYMGVFRDNQLNSFD